MTTRETVLRLLAQYFLPPKISIKSGVVRFNCTTRIVHEFCFLNADYVENLTRSSNFSPYAVSLLLVLICVGGVLFWTWKHLEKVFDKKPYVSVCSSAQTATNEHV